MANYEELAQVEDLKQIQSESLEIAKLKRDLFAFEELRDKVYSMFDKNQIDSMMNFDSGNMVPLEENNSSTEE